MEVLWGEALYTRVESVDCHYNLCSSFYDPWFWTVGGITDILLISANNTVLVRVTKRLHKSPKGLAK